MSLPRRSAPAALAVGVVALVAACGGGDDAGRLGPAEYRERADAVCAEAGRAVEAVPPADAAEDLPARLEGLVEAQNREIVGLQELSPPEDLQDTHDELIERLADRRRIVQDAADEIAAGADPGTTMEAAREEVVRLRARARSEAEVLGLDVCGTGRVLADDAGGDGSADRGGATGRFARDARAATEALEGVGEELESTESVDDLNDRLADIRAGLDAFDAAVARIDRYTLDDPGLEERRAGLAETGPRVGSVLRRFVEAAAGNEAERVEELLPEVTEAVSAFQSAARGEGGDPAGGS